MPRDGPALLPLSPSGLGPLGSGSNGRLLSGSGGRASLSGLSDLGVARGPLSLSGGGQGPLAASESRDLVGPLAAEQLPSVSASAGGAGGAGGLPLPLSAVLHLSPAPTTCLSGLLAGLRRPLLEHLAQVATHHLLVEAMSCVDLSLEVDVLLGVALGVAVLPGGVGVDGLLQTASPVAPPLCATMVTVMVVSVAVTVVVTMTMTVTVTMTVPMPVAMTVPMPVATPVSLLHFGRSVRPLFLHRSVTG